MFAVCSAIRILGIVWPIVKLLSVQSFVIALLQLDGMATKVACHSDHVETSLQRAAVVVADLCDDVRGGAVIYRMTP